MPFHEDIRQLWAISSQLRTWLASRRVILKQKTTRCKVLTLASQLYKKAEGQSTALKIAQQYLASQKRLSHDASSDCNLRSTDPAYPLAQNAKD